MRRRLPVIVPVPDRIAATVSGEGSFPGCDLRPSPRAEASMRSSLPKPPAAVRIFRRPKRRASPGSELCGTEAIRHAKCLYSSAVGSQSRSFPLCVGLCLQIRHQLPQRGRDDARVRRHSGPHHLSMGVALCARNREARSPALHHSRAGGRRRGPLRQQAGRSARIAAPLIRLRRVHQEVNATEPR